MLYVVNYGLFPQTGSQLSRPLFEFVEKLNAAEIIVEHLVVLHKYDRCENS